MYIPELDALIFLATEYLEEDVDRPVLQAGIKALHEAAGADYDKIQMLQKSEGLVLLTLRSASLQGQTTKLVSCLSAAKFQTDSSGGDVLTFLNSWGCPSR